MFSLINITLSFSSFTTGMRVRLAALHVREDMPDLLEQLQVEGQLEREVVVEHIRLNTRSVYKNIVNNLSTLLLYLLICIQSQQNRC